jgi:hypothetical protein
MRQFGAGNRGDVAMLNDANSTRRKTFEKMTGIGARSSAMRQLASSLKDLVGLERQAFSIDAEEAGPDDGFIPLEERLEIYAKEKAIKESDGKVVEIGAVKPVTTPN